MRQRNLLPTLEKEGVILRNDHLVYSSGRHGSDYVKKEDVLVDPTLTREVCEQMFLGIPLGASIDAFAAPELGAVILGHKLADMYTTSKLDLARFIPGRKDGNGGFKVSGSLTQYINRRNIWVVEDVLTTGGTVKAFIKAIRAYGGRVQGVSVFCNRGGLQAGDLDIPYLHAAVTVQAESWPADECRLCAENMPINTTLGHGAKFLASRS